MVKSHEKFGLLKRKLHTLALKAVRCCAPCIYACTLRTCSKLAKNRRRILFLIFREIWRVKNDKYRLGKKCANAERSHRFHSAEMFSHRFHSAEIYSHRFHRFTQIVRVRSVFHRIHRSMVQKKSHRFHRARRSLSLKHLCNSVKSVGVYLIRSFCEFGVFRGSTSHQKLL